MCCHRRLFEGISATPCCSTFMMMQQTDHRFTAVVIMKLIVVLVLNLATVSSFTTIDINVVPPYHRRLQHHSLQRLPSTAKSTLFMVSSSDDGGNMKKRRRRKIQQQEQQPTAIGPIMTPSPKENEQNVDNVDDEEVEELANKDQILAELKAVASFKPTTKEERKLTTSIISNNPIPSTSSIPSSITTPSISSGDIDLPDIKNVLQKKELKKIMMQEEEKEQDTNSLSRPKISRKDKEAYLRVCVPLSMISLSKIFFYLSLFSCFEKFIFLSTIAFRRRTLCRC